MKNGILSKLAHWGISMRSIILALILTIGAFPASAKAQSLGDILGVIDTVVEIDKKNAERKRQEEARKKKEQELAKQRDLTVQSSQVRDDSQPTTIESTIDDGGYGDVYDKMESLNSNKTDEQLFSEIKPYLGGFGANICMDERSAIRTFQINKTCESICKPLKSLIEKDYYPAVSVSLTDIAFALELHSIEIVAQSFSYNCDLKYSGLYEKIYSAAGRIPEVRQSKQDTYNLFLWTSAAKKYDVAREYLLVSANLGFDKAQYDYADVLLKQNQRKEAFIYLNKSAEQGFKQAIQKLKQDYDYDFLPKNKPTPAITVAQSFNQPSVANTPSPSTSSAAVPSVMARDYWVKNESTAIVDKNNNEIGVLSFGTQITTYGEKDGLGKIDLMEDKWVQLFNLSTSKPVAKKSVPIDSSVNNKVQKSHPKTQNTSSKLDVRDDTLNLTRYVSGSSLNYRDAPNGNKIGSFPRSTRLIVYERSGEWVRVSKYNAPQNWVHEDYISSSKPNALPAKRNTNRVRSDSFSQGVTRMGMNACKASIFTAARNRGVTPVNVINTRSAYISRIPISPSRYDAYDLVTCSRLDGTRGVKRIRL